MVWLVSRFDPELVPVITPPAGGVTVALSETVNAVVPPNWSAPLVSVPAEMP